MRKPIQSPVPQYQPLPGIQEQTIREWRGVNTYDPYSIGDSYFTEMANLTADDYPAVSVRPGYSVLGSAIGSKVLGLGVWKDAELHAVFNDGTWRKWDGAAWTTLASGLDTAADWSFTNFQGNLSEINLLGANGVNPIKRYNGSSVSNLSNAPSGGNYITNYSNRLWCAVGKEVHACALDQPTTWTLFDGTDEDSYVKDMESSRGENVNMLSGGLAKLTIGMPGSLHEMYGSLPSNFATRPVTEDSGVASNKSAVTQEGVMFLLHQTGIYRFTGGVLPDKSFADIIRGLTGNIGSAAAAGSDNAKLYFYDGAGRLLVFDSRSNAWSVWKDIVPTCFAVMQHKLYIGDNQGRVLLLGGAADDGGTPISWHAVTKPFTNSSMARRQRWLKCWIMAELAAGSSLSVYLSSSATGDADWELMQTITGTGGSNIQRIIIPVAKFARENTVRVKLAGTGWVRLHEFTRQVRQLSLN